MSRRTRRSPPKEMTKYEKVGVALILILIISLASLTLAPVVQANLDNRCYIELTSPEIEKLEVYAGMYFDARSLDKRLSTIENMSSIRLDMRYEYQMEVFEKIVFTNGTFEWHKHSRFVFDYLSLNENNGVGFIPLIDTNLTITIVERV